MGTGNRPSVRFRRIGSALRNAREDAGLTLETAARRFCRSPGWLSTVENGLQPIRADDLTDLLDLYQFHDEALRTSLIHLARQARRKNWTRTYEDRISPAALDLAGLESDSASLRNFHPCLIPGLLQNEEYARTIIEAGLPSSTRDNEQLIAFRLARQQVLNRSEPPTYCAIIGEAALHQIVGSRDIMRAQLAHIAQVARSSATSLRILPYSAGKNLWVGGPFHLVDLRPPGQMTVTVIENFNKSSFIDDESESREYDEVFAHLLAATLDESRSLQVINQIRFQHEGSGPALGHLAEEQPQRRE